MSTKSGQLQIASNKQNFTAIKNIVESNKDEQTKSKAIKEYFCAKDKPKRSINTKIKVIIPKIDSSVAVDEAQKIRSEYIETARRLVKDFYYFGQSAGRGLDFLDRRCRYQMNERDEADFLSLAPIHKVAEINFVFDHNVNTNIVWLYQTSDTETYPGPADGRCGNVKLTKQLEIHALTERFTLLEEGISISQAVNRQEELWRNYLISNLSLAESPDKNPATINMETKLDLTKFCAYGRPLSDLTAK